ncbi:hypothetical protein QN277_022163 [Acacia crassicarpa]|uniref:RRM domain-containing protein n=1 Tax=Acacia crassicarpa TaxID=499986 RepID=A0AAE1K9E2_9FABA|nr:hypothetical protein QN277_022163 [Acacia crassicarpa]
MEAILCLTPPFFSVSRNKPQIVASAKWLASCSSFLPSAVHSLSLGVIFSPQPFTSDPSSYSSLWKGRSRKARVLAVVDEETALAEDITGEKSVDAENDDVFHEREPSKVGRPCELYVCNLPRSCDSTQLYDLFKPYGFVLSAEVDRNDETGESRGCAYVTMGSLNSARKAVAALDRSDIGGREMRVRFSAEMNPGRSNVEAMNSLPLKVLYHETPHKLYIGNLARVVEPGDLWNHFRRFGTVVSVRILHNRSSRVYAFLSFLSQSERDAALSLNGTELCGRILVVREAVERTVP